ncbi:hypothetical protein Btru_017038 [Bulinus truncatus]|nr:hypothetical protein Btru_017038 [Bulinus truncatus]
MRRHSQAISRALCITASQSLIKIFPVDCITCAVCRSSDHGCEGGHVAPTICSPEHNKCFTRHVYIQSVQGTYRGCTNQSFSTEGCIPLRIRGREGVLCTSLCDWDDCNSAFGLGPRRSRLVSALTSRRRR